MAAALLVAAVGCDNDLPVASEITHLRVLGAKTQVVNDEQRASPKPGETATLSWTVVFGDPMTSDAGVVGDKPNDSELSSIFIVCTMPEQFAGVPVCQEFVDISSGGSISDVLRLTMGPNRPDCEANPDRVYDTGRFGVACVTGQPKIDVAVAKNVTSRAKLVQGIICRNGTPQLDLDDPTGTSCKPRNGVAPEDVERIAVYGTIPIQYTSDDKNDNPSLEAASLLFHDPPLPWRETTPEVAALLDESDDNCLAQAQARRVMHTDGHEELITLQYDASKREIYDGQPEDLEFSAYVTMGELSRRFTVFTPESETPLKNTFTWKISPEQRKELDEASKRVRFYFTLMDRRGGFAVTSRDLCIDRE